MIVVARRAMEITRPEYIAQPERGEMRTLLCRQEFDTHVKSLVARQLEPPKKADAEFGVLGHEVGDSGVFYRR